MSDFLFSLNVTLPIFLVMVLGYVLRRINLLNDNFVTVVNKFNFKVTLPAMLFYDMARVDIKAEFDVKFVLFCAIASSISFWGIWGLAKLFVKDDSIRGAFVQGSFRSSAAVMGLAFINNIYGASAMGPMMIIGAVPLYNIYAVIVLTFEAEGSEKRDWKKIRDAALNILKNPIILSIALGVVFALLGIKLPTFADKTVASVATLATPLALVGLGAGFEGKKAIKKLAPTIWASMIKMVILPLVFLPIAAYVMDFSGEKMIAILIMLAAPTTPSCYIMAKNMKNDGVLTASIVVLTTMVAAFTMTGWIFLLKKLCLI